MLRIQGQQHNLVTLRRLQLRYSFAGEWMPVPHRYEATHIETATSQFRFQRPRLPLGESTDGRASANDRIMMLHFTRARR